MSSLLVEKKISYVDFEDAFEKELAKGSKSDEEKEAVLNLFQAIMGGGLIGVRFVGKLKDQFGFDVGRRSKDVTSKPRTGITIQDKRWNQAKKIFYQKAKSKAAKYANDSGGTAGIQQKVLKDESELTAMMKSFNSISKETQGLKAPIFPEGKRRPKSKLIHKRSLTEAIFSDDD